MKLIASYNPSQMGDVLVIIMHPDVASQLVTQRGQVVRITSSDEQTLLGINFWAASQLLPELKQQSGPVVLNAAAIDKLNAALQAAGFTERLTVDTAPKFVVGYVKTVQAHPKSEHLQITETEVQAGQVLKIVSGSPNMRAGIKVVVAESGTMMPSGLIIWPGDLKGVESDGMICSGRELRLPNAPQKPGALILPDDYQVGTPFDFQRAQHLFE